MQRYHLQLVYFAIVCENQVIIPKTFIIKIMDELEMMRIMISQRKILPLDDLVFY